MNNMNIGGAEKALISLLNELDYSKFEVDLQLFKREGMFLGEIPQEVRILNVPENYQYFDCSIKTVLKTFNLNLIYNRYRFWKIRKKANSPAEAEQLAWKFVSRTLDPLSREYDVAVGYLENSPNYFAVDKVRAKTKIGFIHNDYINIKVNPQLDQPYFKKLNYICSVSPDCVNILNATFPMFEDKIKLVPNLFSEQMIFRKSRESVTEVAFVESDFNMVSIGRLAEQKGFDLAINAASILKKEGFRFKWLILGEGPLRGVLEKQIADFGLAENFILFGNQINPYKFLRVADLVVQTSRFEGKSIALDEAKILSKVILTTSYPTVADQITHQLNGFICGLSAQEIAESIRSIANTPAEREKIVQYLTLHRQKVDNKLLELL